MVHLGCVFIVVVATEGFMAACSFCFDVAVLSVVLFVVTVVVVLLFFFVLLL